MLKDQDPPLSGYHHENREPQVYVPLSDMLELVRKSHNILSAQARALNQELYLAGQQIGVEKLVLSSDDVTNIEETLEIEADPTFLTDERLKYIQETAEELVKDVKDRDILIKWLEGKERELEIEDPEDDLAERLSDVERAIKDVAEKGRKEDVREAVEATLKLFGLALEDLSTFERLSLGFLVKDHTEVTILPSE